MRQRPLAYPGRVIFDHLAKTAGMAVNAWLRSSLGAGCVTTNIIGSHREVLSRYGGNYSVISGHIAFLGEGLDPRYKYVTCLREPIDRALSWLFYVRQNHTAYQLGELWRHADLFLETEGEEGGEALINNYYLQHFSAVDSSGNLSDDQKLELALSAIESYDIWGFHDALPEFLGDFAALLEVPAPAAIARINETRERVVADRISTRFRRRLEYLNAFDIEFYRILRGRYEDARRRWQRPAVAVSSWSPFERQGERIFDTTEFALLAVTLEGGESRTVGGVLNFLLEFSLSVPVPELEIGIHIFDEFGRWAFGTNTTLLGEPLNDMCPGTYREHWAVVADLPEGDYTVGFAFAERQVANLREIAFYYKLVSFRLTRRIDTRTAGYVSVPATVVCKRTSDHVVRPVMDSKGGLRCDAVLGDMTPGERLSLPVVLTNASTQDWVSLPVHPVNLSYRWFDEHGNVTVANGERTPLPDGALHAGASLSLSLTLKAPHHPGRFRLSAMPVQEMLCWFNERGFAPLEMVVTVVADDQARHFPARDIRLGSEVGCVDEFGRRTSDGRAGHLLYGPGVMLPAGNWRAVLSGLFDSNVGIIRADVIAGRGTQTFVQSELAGSCDCHFMDFALDLQVDDLEVRIWVDAGAVARVDSVSIEPRQRQAESPMELTGNQNGKEKARRRGRP